MSVFGDPVSTDHSSVHARREMTSTCTNRREWWRSLNTTVQSSKQSTKDALADVKHRFFCLFLHIPIMENADWLVWCMQPRKWHKMNGDSTHQCGQCAATVGSRPWIKSRPGKNTIDLTQKGLFQESAAWSNISICPDSWFCTVSQRSLQRFSLHDWQEYFSRTTEILLQNKDDCLV